MYCVRYCFIPTCLAVVVSSSASSASQLQVNPKYLILESDFTNNVVRCNIHYTGRFVTTTNCKISQSWSDVGRLPSQGESSRTVLFHWNVNGIRFVIVIAVVLFVLFLVSWAQSEHGFQWHWREHGDIYTSTQTENPYQTHHSSLPPSLLLFSLYIIHNLLSQTNPTARIYTLTALMSLLSMK